MMKCPNVHQLAEYFEGLCAPRQHQRLSEHIDGCARCRAEMAALQHTTKMLDSVPSPRIPADLWSGVAARITSPSRRVVAPWMWRTAAGVGLVASLLVGVLVINRPQPSLPYTTAVATSYVSQHQLLSTRDPLSDRANIGVLLTLDQGNQ